MKKSLLSLALLAALFGGAAHADVHGAGAVGAVGIGGQASLYGGTITGNAGASSTGSAITSTEVIGNGGSMQRQANQTGATAAVGGSIGPAGTSVVATSNEFSNSQGVGHTWGGTPNKVGGSIVNGGTAFGDGEGVAGVTGSFAQTTIGGGFVLGGFVGGAAGSF